MLSIPENTTTLLPCGDWIQYKDEKYFKIINKVGSIEDAENACKIEDKASTLLFIHSKH